MKSLWYRMRLAWPVLVVALGLLVIHHSGSEVLHQQTEVLAWKLLLVGVATILAHLVRVQLFPYFDLSAALQEKTQAGSTAFLAVSIIYAAIILAVCSGL